MTHRISTPNATEPPSQNRLVEPCVLMIARYRRSTMPVRIAISAIDSENRRMTVGSSKCHWTVCFGKNVIRTSTPLENEHEWHNATGSHGHPAEGRQRFRAKGAASF